MSARSFSKDTPPLALLAGGLGTRLGSLAADMPKSLVTVAGEPFIAHQLRLLAGQGIRDIVICCGYRGDQIRSFVGDGSRFSCCVRYSCDGSTRLGTGGAIRRALPLLGTRFWVMYGDSYLTASFAPMLQTFEDSGQPALMAVFANDDRWEVSNIEFAGGRVLHYDKRTLRPDMRHIDYGVGLYAAQTFSEWPEPGAFDLSDLQSSLAERGAMAGHEVTERFYEIGSISGVIETDNFLTAQRSEDPVAKCVSGSDGSYEVRV